MFCGKPLNLKRHSEVFGEDRVELAEAILVAFPRAKSVSVCNAFQDEEGVWHGNGSDIRFYDREYNTNKVRS